LKGWYCAQSSGLRESQKYRDSSNFRIGLGSGWAAFTLNALALNGEHGGRAFSTKAGALASPRSGKRRGPSLKKRKTDSMIYLPFSFVMR
jgi:hypothetical protein